MNNSKSELNTFKMAMYPAKGPWQYRWRRFWHNFRQFFYNIHHAWERAAKGYNFLDLCDLDVYYLNLFEESLEAFRLKTDGHPCEFTEEEWNDILKEMIDHFHRAKPNEYEDNPFADEYFRQLGFDRSNWTFEEQEKFERLTQNYYSIDKRNEEERIEHLNKGMDMLKEYFHYLWF